MRGLIRILEVCTAILLTPILSPVIYRSGWFCTVANSPLVDQLVRLSDAQAYENQVFVVDLMALIFAFLGLCTLVLLAHMAIARTLDHLKQAG